jgi:hypothetical protein
VWVLERIHPYRLSFFKPVAAGLGALAVGLGLQQLQPVGTSLLLVAVHLPVVLAVYAALVLAFGLADEDHLVLDRVGRRLRRRRREAVEVR